MVERKISRLLEVILASDASKDQSWILWIWHCRKRKATIRVRNLGLIHWKGFVFDRSKNCMIFACSFFFFGSSKARYRSIASSESGKPRVAMPAKRRRAWGTILSLWSLHACARSKSRLRVVNENAEWQAIPFINKDERRVFEHHLIFLRQVDLIFR